MRAAAGRFVLAVCCLAGVTQAADRLTSAGVEKLSEALITYGFLRSSYPDFDHLLSSCSTYALTRDMKTLQAALGTLNCDVVIRLAFPHRDLVVPRWPVGQWIGFPGTGESPPELGTLFVTQPMAASPHCVWVVFSSAAPERTTMFWLQQDKSGYRTKLVYDTSIEGEIKNAPETAVGTITSVSIGERGVILVKEWREPGSRPHHSGLAGRVFALDPEKCEIILKSGGTLP